MPRPDASRRWAFTDPNAEHRKPYKRNGRKPTLRGLLDFLDLDEPQNFPDPDLNAMTQSEVALVLGLSPQRIGQIEREALAKVKAFIENHPDQFPAGAAERDNILEALADTKRPKRIPRKGMFDRVECASTTRERRTGYVRKGRTPPASRQPGLAPKTTDHG